jgi:hypothetical protein
LAISTKDPVSAERVTQYRLSSNVHALALKGDEVVLGELRFGACVRQEESRFLNAQSWNHDDIDRFLRHVLAGHVRVAENAAEAPAQAARRANRVEAQPRRCGQ